MYVFKIDPENRVTAHAGTKPIHVPEGEHCFADANDLARLINKWPATRLVEIWNKLPHTKKVLRFTDRKTAGERIWSAIQSLQPSPLGQKNKPRHAKAKAKRNPFGTREGTKAERMIALLSRPSGATLAEIMAETGWQAHSVRGFISGQLSRRLGLRIKSFKNGGERTYRIVKGETA
jgi:hypothetical protein